MKITGTIKGELDIKRCYLPGLKISQKCPHCSSEVKFDGDYEYIGFPDAGVPFQLTMYCRECNHDWEETIQIIIRVVEVQ